MSQPQPASAPSSDFSIIESLWFGDVNDDDAEERAAESLAARIARIEGLKPFPVAAQKLIQEMSSRDYSIEKIVRIIESDAGLATRVLRTVNSAAFALPRKCSSIGHAIVLLGASTLSDLCISLALMSDANNEVEVAVREHCAAVGALARQLASFCALSPDDLFTCGLLHDFGKLLMLQTDESQEYQKLQEACLAEPDATYVRERELYLFDHAVLAGHVLKHWKLPDPIPTVAAWHHQPMRASEDSGVGRIVHAVRVADRLSYALPQDASPEELSTSVAANPSAEYLGISAEDLLSIWDVLHTAAIEGRALFRQG